MRFLIAIRHFFYSFLLYLFCLNLAFGSDLYWLCGPDEDGCPEDGYEYCACIPHSDPYADQPYCLDFDLLSCEPLAKHPTCDKHFIFDNQMRCLATIYHSMPDIPCTLTTYDFCKNHGSHFCQEDGQPHSCTHPSHTP